MVRLARSGYAKLCLLTAPEPGSDQGIDLGICLDASALSDNGAKQAGDGTRRLWQSALLALVRSAGLVRLEDPGLALENPSFDAAALFDRIRPTKDMPAFQGALPGLQPNLRGYQRRALAWMLRRERAARGARDDAAAPGSLKGLDSKGAGSSALHPLWAAVQTLDNQTFYINRCTGRVSSLRFSADSVDGSAVCGGILADEMGLGKTVEVLACVLSHRPEPGSLPPPPAPMWVDGAVGAPVWRCSVGGAGTGFYK